jgi:hypothetical protein
MSSQRPPFFASDTSYGFPSDAFDSHYLPDHDEVFIDPEDLRAFERALQAPDPLQSPVDETAGARSPASSSVNITKRDSQVGSTLEDDVAAVAASAGAMGGDLMAPATPATPTFITAQNDWAPVNPPPSSSSSTHRSGRRGHKKRRRSGAKGPVAGLLGTRTKDETREGYLYQLSKWPLLFFVFAWLVGLGAAYLWTRWYIWVYEHFFTWRGQRQRLRSNMRRTSSYETWVAAARELDRYLGRQTWREQNEYAYYDSKTVRRVWEQMRKTRAKAEAQEAGGSAADGGKAVEDLKALIEACVKNNFVGVENARLYSQTYYGTKNLVQNFVDEGKGVLLSKCIRC